MNRATMEAASPRTAAVTAPVLQFIDTTGPGGAETVLHDLSQGLRNRGWPARQLLVGPGWVLDTAKARAIPVDVVPTRGRFDLAYLRGIRDIVKRHDIRLIHAHLFSPAVYASLVGMLEGVPVVATMHGASDAESAGVTAPLRYRMIERTHVVCVSDSLAKAMRTRVDPRRVRVIHNGVDTQRFGRGDGGAVRAHYGIPDDAILVGALGNVRPAKDFATFIRAAAELANDPRFHFAIVGDPAKPLHDQLVRLRDELGLGDRFRFWGFRSDVPDVIAAFDLLAISSSTEGFSLAAIQAMAAGKPVVATRSGGPEEILTDGQDGLLVPVAAPGELARAIRRLADDPSLRARLVDAARHTVQTRFSLESMIDRYEALYREVLPR